MQDSPEQSASEYDRNVLARNVADLAGVASLFGARSVNRLIADINAMLPAVPQHMRDEMRQMICLEVVEGRLDRKNLKSAVGKALTRYYRNHPVYGHVSWEALRETTDVPASKNEGDADEL